jgi:RNA polymerase sigma-70 factor (ECF subfamily)
MDAATFSEMYQEGLPRTIRFLLSLGFPRDTVSEIAETAWSRAWERLNQLRDDSKMLSWVNTIALNDARKTLRRAKQHISITPDRERITTLNVAAIDISKILDLCPPKDREILEAHLDGVSNMELAESQGVSEAAMRLRSFRARRAARRACDHEHTESQLQRLSETFRKNAFKLAHQYLANAETFLRLMEMTSDRAKRQKLYDVIGKSIVHAQKSFGHLSRSHVDVAKGLLEVADLRKRLRANTPEVAVNRSAA